MSDFCLSFKAWTTSSFWASLNYRYFLRISYKNSFSSWGLSKLCFTSKSINVRNCKYDFNNYLWKLLLSKAKLLWVFYYFVKEQVILQILKTVAIWIIKYHYFILWSDPLISQSSKTGPQLHLKWQNFMDVTLVHDTQFSLKL